MAELDEHQPDRGPEVYQHSHKVEWGHAVVVWEREGKRGYQFEDGQLRVFTSNYYHLLGAVDVSIDLVRKLVALAASSAKVAAPNGSVVPRLDVPALSEQIACFLRAYPGGFGDEKWRQEHRGGAGRSLKRHRDRAISAAQEQFTPENLTAWIDREHDGIECLCQVLGKTDLVTASEVQALRGGGTRALLTALRDLLLGEVPPAERLVAWIRALGRHLGRSPTWGLATLPLALMEPPHHVCVQRSKFLAQAESMAPLLRPGTTPNGPEYLRLLTMAQRVRDSLIESEAPPADMFDVCDFMSCTLDAPARKDMAAHAGPRPRPSGPFVAH